MKLKSIEWDGRQISKPGLYSKVPLSRYHDPKICVGPSISTSGLTKINPDIGSPAHFYAQWRGNPKKSEEDEIEEEHFVLGRALHHLILGEPFFAKQYVQQPEEYPDKKSGELKKWRYVQGGYCDNWRKSRLKEGRSILTSGMIEQIKQMSVSLGNHPLVKHGLLNGLIERSFFWKDKETGIWLKWRPDSVPIDTDPPEFGDIKTTTSTLYPDLVSVLRKRAYYQGAALGRVACREILGTDMGSYTLIFVEKKPPYWSRDFRMDLEDLDRGDRMNRACIRTFASCLKSGFWPGPGYGNEGNERLMLSKAAREQIDSRLQNEGLADGVDSR